MSKKHIIAVIFGVLIIAFGIYTITLSVKGPGDIEVYTGTLNLEEGAEDTDFDIYVDSVILMRKVEMYQYVREGKDVIIDFSEKSEGTIIVDDVEYENPKFPKIPRSKIFYGKVTIGDSGLYLSDGILKKFSLNNYINFDDQPDKLPVSGMAEKDMYFGLEPIDDFTYASPGEYWEIGDLRVTWYGIDPEDLAPIYTGAGGVKDGMLGDPDFIQEIYDKEMTKEAIVDKYKSGNKGVGIGLIFFGIVVIAYGTSPKWKKKKPEEEE